MTWIVRAKSSVDTAEPRGACLHLAMATSDCICQKKSTPLQLLVEYPTLKEGQDPVQLLNEYGFFVLKGALSGQEVERCKQAITSVCKSWYAKYLETGAEGPDWEEVANRRPSWKEGKWKPEPGQEELGFRRLYRMTEPGMTEQSQVFADMCRHEKVSLQTDSSCACEKKNT